MAVLCLALVGVWFAPRRVVRWARGAPSGVRPRQGGRWGESAPDSGQRTPLKVRLKALSAQRIALAVAQLRAWWHGGSFLRHQRGGAGGHSERYRRVMGSAGWRRRRAQVLRRQGGRCAVPGCAQRAVDVHHAEGYARLGRERPDELLGVCERHHRQLHGRG